MKAISLWQPWASLMASGAKRIETRDWAPRGLRAGQLVAIHAAKQWTGEQQATCAAEPFARALAEARERGLWSSAPPLGGVVAIARFHGAYPTDDHAPGGFDYSQMSNEEYAFGNYTPGRYGWLFTEVRPVALIPARGQQGLFEWEAPREIASLYQGPLDAMAPGWIERLLRSAPSAPSAPESVESTDPLHPTRVVHCRRDAFDIYIGRPMPRYPELKPTGWGNPFKDALQTTAGWQSAVDRYRTWILEQPQLLARLAELRGKRLGCWCAPAGGLPGELHGQVCHGEVLAALADRWCAVCGSLESPAHVRRHLQEAAAPAAASAEAQP